MEKMFWTSQKLLTYIDPVTTVKLELNLEHGLSIEDWGNSYVPTRLLIVLRDSRVGSNKIQFELHFNELNMLSGKYEQYLKQTKGDLYNNNCQITIPKRTQNTMKELGINFVKDGEHKRINLTVLDKTSNSSLCSIVLTQSVFSSFIEIIKQLKNNYINITSNLMINTNVDRMCQENDNNTKNINNNITIGLTDIVKKLSNISVKGLNENQQQIDVKFNTHIKEFTKNIEELNEEIISNDNLIQSDITQHDFSTFLNNTNLNDFDIGIDNDTDKLNESTKTIIKEEIHPKFLYNFINYDLQKLYQWNSAFINCNEKSSFEMFCPLTTLLDECLIQTNNKFISNNFYNVQYISAIIIKKMVINLINKTSDGKIPIYKFQSLITPSDTDMWNISKELFLTFLYLNVMNNMFKKIKSLNETDLLIFKQNFFIHKLIYGSFLVSIDWKFIDKFKEDVIELHKSCLTNGYFESVQKEYSLIAIGGSIRFDMNSLNTSIDKMISGIQNLPVFTDNNINEMYSLLNIQKPNEDLTTIESVKQNVINKYLNKNDIKSNEVIESKKFEIMEDIQNLESYEEENIDSNVLENLFGN